MLQLFIANDALAEQRLQQRVGKSPAQIVEYDRGVVPVRPIGRQCECATDARVVFEQAERRQRQVLIIDAVFCKAIDQQRFQIRIETSELRGSHRLGQPGPEAQRGRLVPYRRPVCAKGFIVPTGLIQRIGEVVVGRGIIGPGLYGGLETRNCGD